MAQANRNSRLADDEAYGLYFQFSEVLEEIEAMSRIAEGFIDPGTLYVFPQLRDSLIPLQAYSLGTSYEWGIQWNNPLRTKVSFGEYEPDDQGERNVFAEIRSIWKISPSDKKASKYKPHRTFALTGKASTRVDIKQVARDSAPVDLAMWRMEIGDANSPGCHFHVQVLAESDIPPFPKTLSVPRFPGLLLTPMDVLEFVLGELFQDKWREHAASETPAMKNWQRLQRKRLRNLASWENDQLSRSSGSPWTALKWAKPPTNLFL